MTFLEHIQNILLFILLLPVMLLILLIGLILWFLCKIDIFDFSYFL